MFADFKPSGADDLTLGSDLSVPGKVTVAEQRSDARVSMVDGYTVTLEGDLVPGEASEVTLGVVRDGQPVTDLEPYLGAYGHLVALRSGDLAYLHVHPDGSTRGRQDAAGADGGVRGRGPEPGQLPPLPGLQARRSGPHGRVRSRGGTWRRG